MTSGKDTYARKAGKYFDEGLKERADVFALMGKVRGNISNVCLFVSSGRRLNFVNVTTAIK